MPRTEKLSRLALVSLALNAGLTSVIIYRNHRDSRAGRSQPIPSLETGGARGDTPEHADHQAHASARDAGQTEWKELLRRSDIPRHVFIAAIQAEFQAKWSQRDADLQKRYRDGKAEIEDLALLNLDREIALEATMREALGEDAFREWDRGRKFFDINTGALALTEEEANKLHPIRTALTDRLRALERAKLKKELDPATYEARYETAQADYEQELRKLVGFQRFNEARDSGIPAYLRRDLRGLGITETQFSQVQDIEGNFGDGKADLKHAAESGTIDAGKLDQEQEALAQLREAQLQQALGENAYAIYRKQQDPRYQTMTDFAKSWQLTDQDVENVFQLLHAHDTEARRIKLDAYAAGRLPEEVQAQLSGVQTQLDESLLRTLSPGKVETLRRNGIVHP